MSPTVVASPPPSRLRVLGDRWSARGPGNVIRLPPDLALSSLTPVVRAPTGPMTAGALVSSVGARSPTDPPLCQLLTPEGPWNSSWFAALGLRYPFLVLASELVSSP
jgi:hypothetical protein